MVALQLRRSQGKEGGAVMHTALAGIGAGRIEKPKPGKKGQIQKKSKINRGTKKAR